MHENYFLIAPNSKHTHLLLFYFQNLFQFDSLDNFFNTHDQGVGRSALHVEKLQ